jgi:2-polyprenyl-6-methoxyphenol hydroxylase-like FAD-dependent oxidoreductase
VLISGAGIAGPVLAYWLSKAGVCVTVVERADRLRKEGQTVDMEDEAVTIMKWMGIEEEVRKATTKEVGAKIVDSNNKIRAAFPQYNDGASFSKEFEIVRGELATIFYETSKDNVEYLFGDSITLIQESDTCALVTFASQEHLIREFDVIIVSEGLASRTRAMVFNEDVRAPIKPLDMCIISFSFQQGTTDDQWARMYHAPHRKGLLIRSDGFGRVRANAMVIDEDATTQVMANSRDRTKQKEYFIDIFKDVGWEAGRIMDGLRDADDLYVQEIAQAKCKTWSKGRVVLVGDTAYCPSPASGQGTTAAMIGAYILAAEIVKHQDDHHVAFDSYETMFRPWIEERQQLPPGFPALGLPETQWGIRILHIVLYVFSLAVRSGLFTLFFKITEPFSSSTKLKLPDPSIFERL